MLNRNRWVIALVAAGLLSACSARQERFVEPPVEADDATTTQTTTPEDKGIAPLEPLAFIEGEPESRVLGSMGTTQAFQVGGVSVIHKATPANSVVAARLYLIGGATNLTPQTTGIEELALGVAAAGGSETTPKDEFNGLLDSMGAEIWTFTDRDFSGYGLKTVVDNFDASWKLFEESILEPAMPADEIELLRQRQLASIASLLENPDSHLRYVATRNLFEGHPYYQLHVGTEETVKGFTRADLRAYQRSLIKPENMLLVVVGNVSASDLIERVKKSFGRLETQERAEPTIPVFSSAPSVEIADRKLPTNYVLGYFAAPKPGQPDYPAMVVATEYLRDKLFEEVRTKRNLTYAVSAGVTDKRQNYGYLYVTAKDPKTTMGVIFNQIEEMKLIQIPKSELDQTVNVYLTQHYMGAETNGGQASMLAKAQIVSGDWRLAEAFLAEIRSVTPEDVQNVTTRYFKDYRFGVVGDKGTLQEGFFKP